MNELVRSTDDLMKTSSGVGHRWRTPQNFPNMDIMTSITSPLPEKLSKLPEIQTSELYKTTTSTAHDHKLNVDQYGNFGPFFKKPPAHYKVHYNKDLHEKLMSEKLRRPLTMGNQWSETREEFSGRSPLKEPERYEDFRGFTLRDHLKTVPTQPTYSGIPPETFPHPPGGHLKSINNNRSVYLLNDPYLTTSHKDHRRFREDEIYLEPKAKLNVLEYERPHLEVPQQTPMFDKLMFKQATRVNHVPSLVAPVPHSGFRTEYRENFELPSDLNPHETSVCPTDFKCKDTGLGSFDTIPLFYDTEYKKMGSKCKVNV